MPRFTLKPLPYPPDALEPVMSAPTVQLHHDRYQAECVRTLNTLVQNSVYAYDSLESRWRVVSTDDADNPLLWAEHPLWVCDLWEHAYCFDWQQDRAGFLRGVVDRLINWQHITVRLQHLRERHVA
jgi:superoxide dismutase